MTTLKLKSNDSLQRRVANLAIGLFAFVLLGFTLGVTWGAFRAGVALTERLLLMP